MIMPKNTERTNTPTEQNKEDNTLVLYRLTLVEAAVKEVGDKMDHQDNIKRADFIEFRETLLGRISDIKLELLKDITAVQKELETKADQKQLDDLRTFVKSVAGFLSTVIASLVIFYITKGEK